ncbi:DUF4376 domain-containing protein [Bradyrhizobium septentrionale]|uniref:DUF4376 domain-containing protein n=1 Tax=Bradyrhizobium septentrionale TaxID=1404411 RepID=A0A974A057_9BRAD|nr:DUF4376 domain-containing protein [Bradyrhizobium septentrionale]UGY13729.1 DUF4376 domain-containing protein [Bradyrhizobium septentrionale]
MMMFNAKDWYWSVAGDAANVYSSARNIYVPLADSAFTAWMAANGLAAAPAIASEADIWDYVQSFQPWWLWDAAAGKVSQPAVDQYTKPQLQGYAITVRTTKVNGGMVAGGIPVLTDDRSRQFIADARRQAEADDTWTTKWFASDMQFYDVTAVQMIEMSDAVNKHTNDCYTVFQQVSHNITINVVTTLAQIDTAFTGL